MHKLSPRVNTSNQTVDQKKAHDKQWGHRIANLEKELKTLDQFEDVVKNRMQDRFKIMSGKNARCGQLTLDRLEERRMLIKTELNRLQESDERF